MASSLLAALRKTIADVANSGIPVVVDDLLFDERFLLHYAELLDHQQTWVVGVRCDAEPLNQRECARTGRSPGTALEHMVRVYVAIPQYDLDVYTDQNSPRELAEQVIERLQSSLQCLASVSHDL